MLELSDSVAFMMMFTGGFIDFTGLAIFHIDDDGHQHIGSHNEGFPTKTGTLIFINRNFNQW
jgi:hypothetical protein